MSPSYLDHETGRRMPSHAIRGASSTQAGSSRRHYDRAYRANARAALYGAPGVISADEVQVIVGDDPHCHYCGAGDRERYGIGIDHVVPLSDGGVNRPENIVPCCHACNLSKFRSDRPGRWSRTVDGCVDCGTSERPHEARGRCTPCYGRIRPRRDRSAYMAVYNNRKDRDG